MNRIFPIVFLSLFAVFVSADETETSKPKTKSPPVTLAVKKGMRLDANLEFEILLNIREGCEIYSQHKNQWLPQLKIEVLDSNRKTIAATFEYPKAKTISVRELPDSDFHVYDKNLSIKTKCADNSTPAFVNVFYHGYHTSGY